MRCVIGCRRSGSQMRGKKRREGSSVLGFALSWKDECSSMQHDSEIQSSWRQTSGECCQWVLDALSQSVEWLCQPLGFEPLTLRRSLDDSEFRLTTSSMALFLRRETASSTNLSIQAPTDYRGFRVSGRRCWLKTTKLAYSGHRLRDSASPSCWIAPLSHENK